MVICKGDGSLMFNPRNGDVIWAEVSSPTANWCRANGYKDATSLEQVLNLEPKIISLPSCEECPRHEECISCCDYDYDGDIEKFNNIDCVAIDEIATASELMSALAALTSGERSDILNENVEG